MFTKENIINRDIAIKSIILENKEKISKEFQLSINYYDTYKRIDLYFNVFEIEDCGVYKSKKCEPLAGVNYGIKQINRYSDKALLEVANAINLDAIKDLCNVYLEARKVERCITKDNKFFNELREAIKKVINF